MRKTTIDIGTNTMLMLIAEYDEKTDLIKTVLDIQRVPRLGKGVDAERNILPESIQKAIDILNEYRIISATNGSTSITATATSFIRDAKNKEKFLSSVKQATGIDIEILPGEDEAKWTFMGGTYDKLSNEKEQRPVCIIDIGGGSTEITKGDNNDTEKPNIKELAGAFEISGQSLDIGSVRLTEKFLSMHPPSFDSIALAKDFIIKHLAELKTDVRNCNLIGVAGTITTLAAIHNGLNKFESDKVDGTVLTIDDIEHIFTRLASAELEELYGMGDFMEGRADIVLPGTLIIKTFMEKFGFNKITVSTKGLRYGIFIREITKA